MGFLAERLRGWPFEDHGLQHPRRPAVRTSLRLRPPRFDFWHGHCPSRPACRSAVSNRRPCRCDKRSKESLAEWSKGVDSSSASASCVGSNPTVVMFLLRRGHGENCSAAPRRPVGAGFRCPQGRGLDPLSCHSRWRRFGVSLPSDVFSLSFSTLASATTAVRRCGLRRGLEAPVHEGVGSNPRVATRFAMFARSARARRAKSSPVPGSAGRCLIQWAMEPAAGDRRLAVALGRAACCTGVTRRRACHRSSPLFGEPLRKRP